MQYDCSRTQTITSWRNKYQCSVRQWCIFYDFCLLDYHSGTRLQGFTWYQRTPSIWEDSVYPKINEVMILSRMDKDPRAQIFVRRWIFLIFLWRSWIYYEETKCLKVMDFGNKNVKTNGATQQCKFKTHFSWKEYYSNLLWFLSGRKR